MFQAGRLAWDSLASHLAFPEAQAGVGTGVYIHGHPSHTHAAHSYTEK